ncbi:MAG: hypothetical protein JNM07_03260 [Phycisphaerae bacterium]|nr:hypothetical protein [Phycisphaerae bacterium]
MGAYPHSTNVPVSQVDAIAAYGDGVESNALYVGGTFVENSTDPTSCSYLARWAAAQPVIMEQPRGKLSEGGAATAQFCVRHATTPAAEFQWFLNGTPIADDPPRVTGATTQKLVIDGTASQDAGTYAVEITNGCGTAVSEGAFCPADFNTDASVDDFDYFDFMNAFTSSDPSADFNEDSSIDDFDYFDFLTSHAAGC